MISRQIFRTEKFLTAICRGIPILDQTWVNSTIETGIIQDPDNFYLKDVQKEILFGFTLQSAVQKAVEHKLLSGMTFYLTPNVVPDLEICKRLVKEAGGIDCIRITSKRLSKLQDVIQKDRSCIIISCTNDIRMYVRLQKMGYEVYTVEFLMMGLTRQELDFENTQFKY